tara:strand:- start:273 stop:515 length:243 start_codon:yes stop_codon:yes gene_type:complete
VFVGVRIGEGGVPVGNTVLENRVVNGKAPSSVFGCPVPIVSILSVLNKVEPSTRGGESGAPDGTGEGNAASEINDVTTIS